MTETKVRKNLVAPSKLNKMIVTEYAGNHNFTVTDREALAPGPGEVQIKVAYCGVCGTDVHIYHGMMDKRVDIPTTIGHEMSGTIAELGPDVSGFSIGEKVVVRPLDNRAEKPSDKGYSHVCRDLKFIGIDSPGAMQQYWNVPAFTLHKLPAETDLSLAALVEPLAVACHDVRLSRLQDHETAVVLGGGPIGLLVALVARHTGATVIVSEPNPTRQKLARDLGFQVVDPTQDDLTAIVSETTQERLADVVFEVAGVQAALDSMTDIAGIRGRIVVVAIHGQPKPINLFQVFWKELEIIGARVYEPEDYDKAISLIAEKGIPFSKLITSIRPMTDIQQVFKQIDENPNGMKVLLDCQQ